MAEERLKILEITPRLTCGGVEKFVVDLCNALALEADVTLLCIMPLDGDPFLLKKISPNIRVITLDQDCSTFFRALKSIPRVCSWIRRLKPDVVHTHLEALRAALPAAIFNFRRIPYLYTVHSDAAKDAGKYLFIHRMIFRIPWIHPVVISSQNQEGFSKAYHLDSFMIENGCGATPPTQEELLAVRPETSSWKTTQQSTVFMSLARISKEKNQFVLSQAVKELSEQGVDLDLVLMGPADDAAGEEILRQIEGLHCPRVHIVGLRTNPLPYLAQMDALVLPSLFEGLPTVVLEAFLLGIPACCTAFGGMKDLVQDGENGFLAHGTDVAAVKGMLARFCALSPDDRARMGKHAGESFPKYSMKNCAAKYLQLMRETGAKRP